MRNNLGFWISGCRLAIFSFRNQNSHGMALIIVLAIVAILSAIGVTFTYNMRMEEKASFNYIGSLKASYITKAGIEYAIAELKKDGGDTGYDWYGDNWGYDTGLNPNSVFGGSDVNVDNTDITTNGTGGQESKWIYMRDEDGNIIGRYAVLVIDESSKININTAGNVEAQQGWSPFEVSLKDFLTAGGWNLGSMPSPQQQTAANRIVYYRHGSPDDGITPKEAGEENEDDDGDSLILRYDGIDNDADGDTDEIDEGIDEPDEFVSWNPYYYGGVNYDTPYMTVEEIKMVDNIGDTIFNNINPYITVYSSDLNTTDSGFLRLNINLVRDAMALYQVMEDAGITNNPAQLAVNIIDYADTDNVPTYLEIYDGTDTTIVRGVEGIRINEVMVKPAYQYEAEDIFDGTNAGGWKEDADTYIYLYGKDDDTDTGVTELVEIDLPRSGYYRLRVMSYDDDFNRSFGVYIYDEAGGEAVLQDTAGLHNTGRWFLDDLGVVKDKNGDAKELSGTVKIKLVGSDNSDTKMCDFIQLSQEPDCEYVELVNISSQDIDIGGWTLTTSGGWAGTIPDGTTISAKDYLVLVVDKDDIGYSNGVGGDNICFENTWPGVDPDKVVELFLSTPAYDIAEIGGKDKIIATGVFSNHPDQTQGDTEIDKITLWKGLLDEETIVAQVDYSDTDVDQTSYTYNGIDVKGYIALEKNDPTASYDSDVDGVDDHWYYNDVDSEVPSIGGGTPGSRNRKCIQFNKYPGENIAVRNLPFATVGGIKDVTLSNTTIEWSKIGYKGDTGEDDTDLIKKLVDRITVSMKRLEAEDCTDKSLSGNWKKNPSFPDEAPDDTFLTYYYSNSTQNDTGIWIWGVNERINPDTSFYTLYISGKVEGDGGDTLLVKATTGAGEYESRGVSFSNDNIARYGQIKIAGGLSGGDTDLLKLEINNPDSNNTIYFDAAILTPEYKTYGRININTADTPVLQALPGIDATLANNIKTYRETNNGFKNIGEVLNVSGMNLSIFYRISNLITTKSNSFTVICIGQAIRDKGVLGTYEEDIDEILGEKKYMVVVER